MHEYLHILISTESYWYSSSVFGAREGIQLAACGSFFFTSVAGEIIDWLGQTSSFAARPFCILHLHTASTTLIRGLPMYKYDGLIAIFHSRRLTAHLVASARSRPLVPFD